MSMTAYKLFLRSPYVTRGQAAMLLEISKQRVWQLCEKGALVCVHPPCGGSFVLTESVMQYHQRRLQRARRKSPRKHT
jgi:hypothetical protein